MGKTWQEKMVDKKAYPKKLKIEKGFPCYNALHAIGVNAHDEIVITNASDVKKIMETVPKGKIITLEQICKSLGKKYKVIAACSLVAGIHTMTVANAVEEAKAEGKKDVTPWWRTVKNQGELNHKFPGGVEAQKKLLEKEGYKFTIKGKKNIKYFIKDYEKYLIK